MLIFYIYIYILDNKFLLTPCEKCLAINAKWRQMSMFIFISLISFRKIITPNELNGFYRGKIIYELNKIYVLFQK